MTKLRGPVTAVSALALNVLALNACFTQVNSCEEAPWEPGCQASDGKADDLGPDGSLDDATSSDVADAAEVDSETKGSLDAADEDVSTAPDTVTDECSTQDDCKSLKTACTAGVCADGKCVVVPLDDVPCDDGDACTLTDQCESGECVGRDPVLCEPADVCRLEATCDPATGTCSYPSKPDGTSCNADDDGCTIGDACQDGVCTPGVAAACDDGLTCTTGLCESLGSDNYKCTFQLADGGCLIDGACWSSGDPKPGHGCSVCDPASPSIWSTAPDGYSCSDAPGACLAGACIEPTPMLSVPAGAFMMGCNATVDADCEPSEHPYRSVTVPEFSIGVTEVTNQQYRACVAAGGCTDPVKVSDDLADPSKQHHPIFKTLWIEADAYCAWIGARLCSEAEWEKAARGPNGALFPWGNSPATCEYAVMNDGTGSSCGTESGPWPVGSIVQGKSPYNILDLAGNVHEWVADCWHESHEGAPIDGSAWVTSCVQLDNMTERVMKGGTYGHGSAGLRASSRTHTCEEFCVSAGIRCCR